MSIKRVEYKDHVIDITDEEDGTFEGNTNLGFIIRNDDYSELVTEFKLFVDTFKHLQEDSLVAQAIKNETFANDTTNTLAVTAHLITLRNAMVAFSINVIEEHIQKIADKYKATIEINSHKHIIDIQFMESENSVHYEALYEIVHGMTMFHISFFEVYFDSKEQRCVMCDNIFNKKWVPNA
jgi:hypothetical protein